MCIVNSKGDILLQHLSYLMQDTAENSQRFAVERSALSTAKVTAYYSHKSGKLNSNRYFTGFGPSVLAGRPL